MSCSIDSSCVIWKPNWGYGMSRGIRPGRFMFFLGFHWCFYKHHGGTEEESPWSLSSAVLLTEIKLCGSQEAPPIRISTEGGRNLLLLPGSERWTRCGADFQMTGNSESINFWGLHQQAFFPRYLRERIRNLKTWAKLVTSPKVSKNEHGRHVISIVFYHVP